MRKKRVLIGKHLIDNSKYALLSAIEIHNKPIFPYRYEICTLLVINARELLMKAYIYKKISKKKALFKNGKDGMYVSFPECLGMIEPHIGKSFCSIRESLSNLYEYRNKVVHSYGTEYDSVLYSLLSKNIIFYKHFYEEHFNKNFSNDNDLILLPIGFKEIISPIEFLGNESNYNTAPKEVQEFIKNIIVSTKSLNDDGIDDPILGNFQISFQHTNNIKNADFVARLDQNAPIALDKAKKIKISNDQDATLMRFNTAKEEKDFQNQNYPLTNAELKKRIRDKYLYKNRAGVVQEIKKYKDKRAYAYACPGETQIKYKEDLVDLIGSSFPDNPRLDHLNPNIAHKSGCDNMIK